MRNYNIPVFIPRLGCPFECLYCNQNRITSQDYIPSDTQIIATIESHLKTIPPRSRSVEIAFFGGNFTAIEVSKQIEFLKLVYPYVNDKRVNGIRVSTRPDCINPPGLCLLRQWGVTTIELGAQSLSDQVLEKTGRGYSSQQVIDSSNLIKEYGFKLGIQLMVGLPGDDYIIAMHTAQEVTKLPPDFVRIYPTLILKDTPLAKMYDNGLYIPLDIEEAVRISSDMFMVFQRHGIKVIRMGLQPSEDLIEPGAIIAGPFHPSFGELVEQQVFKLQAMAAIMSYLKTNKIFENLTILVNPRDVSKMTGPKRANVNLLKTQFQLNKLIIKASKDIERDNLGITVYDSPHPLFMLSRSNFLKFEYLKIMEI